MALSDILGITLIESRPDKFVTHMVVTHDMLQPHGVLHGGISAALAENAASQCCTDHYDSEKMFFLGVEVSSTHLLPVQEGDTVETIATPIHAGGRISQWKVEQYRLSDGKLFNVSQMTMYGKKRHRLMPFTSKLY